MQLLQVAHLDRMFVTGQFTEDLLRVEVALCFDVEETDDAEEL
jgi:hypothetical protein